MLHPLAFIRRAIGEALGQSRPLSQKEFADRVGISEDYVNAIETGNRARGGLSSTLKNILFQQFGLTPWHLEPANLEAIEKDKFLAERISNWINREAIMLNWLSLYHVDYLIPKLTTLLKVAVQKGSGAALLYRFDEWLEGVKDELNLGASYKLELINQGDVPIGEAKKKVLFTHYFRAFGEQADDDSALCESFVIPRANAGEPSASIGYYEPDEAWVDRNTMEAQILVEKGRFNEAKAIVDGVRPVLEKLQARAATQSAAPSSPPPGSVGSTKKPRRPSASPKPGSAGKASASSTGGRARRR